MTSFRRNPAFEREMRDDPELIAQVRKTTTAVAVAVKKAAPKHSGYYRKHVRPKDNRVIAGDAFAHLVEAGSANNPPYAPLRRGARAAGLRLDDPEDARQ